MPAALISDRERQQRLQAMLYWLSANALAAVLLLWRPQIENSVWFWCFCLPGVMFVRAAYRWLQALPPSPPRA